MKEMERQTSEGVLLHAVYSCSRKERKKEKICEQARRSTRKKFKDIKEKRGGTGRNPPKRQLGKG